MNDFSHIVGYEILSDNAKLIFERVYWLHSMHRTSQEPIKITEHKDHLKVYFENGEWLHYLPNGTWY